jgi:hypothetical protein
MVIGWLQFFDWFTRCDHNLLTEFTVRGRAVFEPANAKRQPCPDSVTAPIGTVLRHGTIAH